MKFLSKLSMFSAVLVLASCSQKKDEVKAIAPVEVKPGSIAYVVEDSLQANYQLCIDARAELDAKAQSYQKNFAQKEQTLQSLQKSIQTRMQNGQISTEDQYKQAMNNYQQQENAYMNYRRQAELELAQEQQKIAVALQDSVNNFLVEYNKTKKCSLILYKGAILYSGSASDITNEVVAGLNARYKKK